jgi:hypothetical protein
MLQNLTLFVKKIVPLFFHDLSTKSPGRISCHLKHQHQFGLGQPGYLIVSRALFNFYGAGKASIA